MDELKYQHSVGIAGICLQCTMMHISTATSYRLSGDVGSVTPRHIISTQRKVLVSVSTPGGFYCAETRKLFSCFSVLHFVHFDITSLGIQATEVRH